MILQNKYIFVLGTWLTTLTLNGKQSRFRSAFVRHLNPIVEKIDLARKDIAESYAEKGEDGEPKKVKNEQGVESYDIPTEKIPDFNKDYAELLENSYVFEISENDKELFGVIKDIVLNTEEKIKPENAENYDAWCAAFEKVA